METSGSFWFYFGMGTRGVSSQKDKFVYKRICSLLNSGVFPITTLLKCKAVYRCFACMHVGMPHEWLAPKEAKESTDFLALELRTAASCLWVLEPTWSSGRTANALKD